MNKQWRKAIDEWKSLNNDQTFSGNLTPAERLEVESNKAGIGRLKYLSFSLIILLAATILLVIPIPKIMNLFIIAGLLISNCYLMSLRLKNIGHKNYDFLSSVCMIVIVGLMYWSSVVTANNDAMGVLTVDVLNLVLGFPLSMYLLLVPSREGRASLALKVESFRIKQKLKDERNALLRTQEIDRLKREIEDLKSKTAS